MWARQLKQEFETITWNYRIGLLAPGFDISSSKTRYGSWNPHDCTIEISEHLIRNFSWDVVLNVLKHEMAHQICSQIFKVPNDGHGEIFQRVCNMIGLDPAFRSASGDLPEGIKYVDNPGPETREARRFTEKIRKLLALAQSSNEHEANLAMAKAAELMDKYNLRMAREDIRKGYGNIIINHKKKRIERHQRKIAQILRDFFYVDIVYSYMYDPELDTEHKVIDIMGKRENVEIAEFIYYFLERKIRELWKANRKNFKGKGIRARNSYYYGLLEGFYKKLQEQNRKTSMTVNLQGRGTTSALVVASDAELNRFVSRRYPRLSKYSASKVRIYMDSYQQGISDGKKITIHSPLHSHDGAKGIAIEK